MAEHQDHADDHGQAFYVKIWAILLVLLILSILGPILAPHLEFGFLKAWMITLMTAFGIAIVKAYLVAANFMHLNIEKRYITYLLTTMLMLGGLGHRDHLTPVIGDGQGRMTSPGVSDFWLTCSTRSGTTCSIPSSS